MSRGRVGIVSALFPLALLAGCGSGGGSGTSDAIAFTGKVFDALPARAFSDAPLFGAHVTICTLQDGKLARIPGASTVIATNGDFSVSVPRTSIPSSGQAFVGAEPSGGGFTLLAPVAQDSLTGDLTQVTSVTANADVNTAMITRLACNDKVITANSNKCNRLNKSDLDDLGAMLSAFFTANPSIVPDPAALAALLARLAADSNAQVELNAWLAPVLGGVTIVEIGTSAGGFTNPTIPAPPPATPSGNPYDGTFTGAYSGTATTVGGSVAIGGSMTLGVAGSTLEGITDAGAVTGSVDQGAGTITVGGVKVQGCPVSFTGNFVTAGATKLASGTWTCAGTGVTASGTWSVTLTP